ncbi:hypothetical protein W97_02548 [Coniosporium apollinis CBS 100218]|uniref:separase n=1 Tax=Coniosporium apollinis (strain CBS 100218) TaxID=1168221 RepID=R7YNT5_CONA1|nr:uncharacterized protein W97_02548 [Coniosporium apollinis CBS 100218]EON63321.1 hypothetical protein W97_02548 [Coniosporium apollinis CBS 100218]
MGSKADARPAADVLRELTSTSICNPSTTARLQDLLSTATNPASKIPGENAEPKAIKRTATTSTRTQRSTADSKTKSRAKASTAVEIHEDVQPLLSPREKYILATETINTTLKTLGDALKPQPRAHKRVSSARNELSRGTEGARTPSKRTSLTRTNSYQQRPLQPRSISQLSNSDAPVKRSAFRRSSSYSVSSRQGPAPGITATAECARLAFAYLRTPEAAKVAWKNLPALQLENGMLALVGKLIAHGLESMAVKELRILKRRLETYMAEECKESKSSKAGISTEKETLASLLEFEHVDLDSPALPLLTSHQTSVLKVAASSRRPATIEAALGHLQLSSPSSPGNLCLAYAKRPGCGAKAARQLETFAQILLSLCPSIAASEDVLACNSKLKPSPEVAFRLQQIAFELRLSWWKLSGHKGDLDKEILEPFLKCLSAFSRRSALSSREKYVLAVELFQRLEESARGAGRDITGNGQDVACHGRTSIYHSLSSLAQSGGLRKEALVWMTRNSQVYETASASEVKRAGIAVRLAALTLEDSSLKDTADSSSLLKKTREYLTGSLKGDSAELDSLFGEVAGLRKAAAKLILQTPKADTTDSGDSEFCALLFSVIAASTNFLARYIGARPRLEADPKTVLRHAHRIAAASKVLKGFIDSVVVSCKAMTAAGTSTFDAIDAILHDLNVVINEVCDCSTTSDEEATKFHEGLGWPMVKVSNTYWILFLRLKKSGGEGKRVLRLLKNATEILSARSNIEKELGSLGMKLGKLGETYEAASHHGRAIETFKAAIATNIDTGALNDAATAGRTRSLQDVWNEPGVLGHLGHSLRALQKITARHLEPMSAESPVYDDGRLMPEERGMILEYQLSLYLEALSKSRAGNEAAVAAVRVLADRLFAIYPANQFPLRRQRVAVALLRIVTDEPNLLSSEVLGIATQSCALVGRALEEDAGLYGYKEHLQATAAVCLAFRDPQPTVEAFKSALRTWQIILDAANTWSALTTAVDDVDAWKWQLHTISEYLDVHGLHFLHVPVLEMLGKVLELQEPPMASELVDARSRLGLQYLRLGYSGKAGLALARAQNLLIDKEVSVEARLQWHLAYAEYLLRIGNTEKSKETLQTAEKLASQDAEIYRATQSSASLSSRIRYNRLLSDACYVQSLLSFETGAYETSLVCARRCHRLNQRVWASLENYACRQALPSAHGAPDSEVDSLVDGMSKLMASSTSSAAPPVVSMTHESLSGARFWSLVPSLFRGLIHLTRLLSHMGMLQEAVCFAEQAQRVAVAAHSDSLTVQAMTATANLWLSSGRLDKGSEYLGKAAGLSKTIEMGQVVVSYKQAMALAHQLLDEKEEELTVYGEAVSIMQRLINPHFIHDLDRINFGEPADSLEKQMEKLSLTAPAEPRRRTVKTAKPPASKKFTIKTPARTDRKDATKPVQSSVHSTADECPELQSLYGEIVRRKATALLLEDKLSDAAELIIQAGDLCYGHGSLVQQQLLVFHSATQHGFKAMAADFTYNVLPESTISFPAVAQALRKLSEPASIRPIHLTPPRKRGGRSPSPRKGAARARKPAKSEDFTALLCKARESLLEVRAAAIQACSTSVIRQVCGALSNTTVLLSATAPGVSKGSMHPLFAAHMSELPKIHALQLEQTVTFADKENTSRAALLKWPASEPSALVPTGATSTNFQQDYIDIIPANWAAISVSLSEAGSDLYVTRYQANQTPFILRLPMARQSSQLMDDEDVFDFTAGKVELNEIIELSDFSTHHQRDMSVKGAKTGWWAEREALDNRLKELLVNIENIWLGGFRGIFSQHTRRQDLLGRFQRSFQNIMNKHLPSRKGNRGQQKKLNLDSRVLELFVGLGDASNEDIDLDEPIMDLLYFVVDILQFSGERNAYDEIDFDSIAVETLEALRAYHSAVAADADTSQTRQHTILILDKNLHAFPWESLPCLQNDSITRLPSMGALRERILTARTPSFSSSYTNKLLSAGHHIPFTSGSSHKRIGTTILNPSGDLQHTQSTLEPHIQTLTSDTWTHIAGRAPTEPELETALQDSKLVLYFGHGSGAQYIRSRTRPPPAKTPTYPPTTLLYGCASAALTTHGAYEPSGMLAAYVAAGAPAVLGMLWDVTDRDCDRFAVRVGEVWGLWPGDGGSDAKKKGRQRQCGSGEGEVGARRERVSLDEAVVRSREACYLRYLNGAAAVVYGIPVYLD